MAEEYDPLQKLGQGNAYDGLVAGRTNKLKKAAAASAFPVGIVVFIVLRLFAAGASMGDRTSPPPRMPEHRVNDDLQRKLDALRLWPGNKVVPPPQDGADDRVGMLRVQIILEKQRIAALAPGMLRQIRQERLAILEAELEKLEAEAAGVGPVAPAPPANPGLVGPPRELKGPGKKGN